MAIRQEVVNGRAGGSLIIYQHMGQDCRPHQLAYRHDGWQLIVKRSDVSILGFGKIDAGQNDNTIHFAAK
nr:hypothetical protein [Devosia sp.]